MAAAKNTAPVENDTVDAEVVEEGITGVGVGSADMAVAIQALNNTETSLYSSIKGDDFDAKLALAKAMANSTPVDESLGDTIQLRNLVVIPVELADSQGAVSTQPRVILIDDEGNAFHATSRGLMSSITNLFASVGEPETWAKPVPIKVVEAKGRNGYKYFTMNLV